MCKEISNMISERHKDALSEIANLGTGHAVSSLSDMLGKNIEMDVPEVCITEPENAVQMVGSTDIVVGIFLRVNGDMNPIFLVVIPKESAFTLLDILMDRGEDGTQDISEMDESALIEIGNIIAGSYTSALADFFDINLNPNPPSMAFDMAPALMEFVLLQYNEDMDNAIVFHTKAEKLDEELTFHIIMLPPRETLMDLLERIDILYSK